MTKDLSDFNVTTANGKVLRVRIICHSRDVSSLGIQDSLLIDGEMLLDNGFHLTRNGDDTFEIAETGEIVTRKRDE
jgi:hypothetical protein